LGLESLSPVRGCDDLLRVVYARERPKKRPSPLALRADAGWSGWPGEVRASARASSDWVTEALGACSMSGIPPRRPPCRRRQRPRRHRRPRVSGGPTRGPPPPRQQTNRLAAPEPRASATRRSAVSRVDSSEFPSAGRSIAVVRRCLTARTPAPGRRQAAACATAGNRPFGPADRRRSPSPPRWPPTGRGS
jgi:hypothetical protein